MSIDAWKAAGQYDEWMFIDYVDYDMCRKLQLKGFKIYQINTVEVKQDLGNIHYNKLLYKIGELLRIDKIKNFSVTYNHSSFRNYYYVRNSLYYINKYADIIDKKSEIKKLIKWEIKKVLLEKNKIKTMKSIYRGFRDYKDKLKEE